MSGWILSLVIFGPLVGAVLLAFAPREAHALIRRAALAISAAVLGLTIAAAVMYYQAGTDVMGSPTTGAGFRLVQSVGWLGDTTPAGGGRIDIDIPLGVSRPDVTGHVECAAHDRERGDALPERG